MFLTIKVCINGAKIKIVVGEGVKSYTKQGKMAWIKVYGND